MSSVSQRTKDGGGTDARARASDDGHRRKEFGLLTLEVRLLVAVQRENDELRQRLDRLERMLGETTGAAS